MKGLALTLLLLSAALTVAAVRGGGEEPATDATIVFHFSRFEPQVVTVAVGVPVTFTLRNQDPIEHEWIVGPGDLHQRHRTGTDPVHDEVPNEVTVPALSTRTTTLTFAEPGEYAFICHLPGHETYGMRGVVRVVER